MFFLSLTDDAHYTLHILYSTYIIILKVSAHPSFFKVWWHAATLFYFFIYLYINRADNFYIYFSPSTLLDAEPGFELQADALLTEPCRTL
jgi:hypothetical protein